MATEMLASESRGDFADVSQVRHTKLRLSAINDFGFDSKRSADEDQEGLSRSRIAVASLWEP